jgi:hypothetical protein
VAAVQEVLFDARRAARAVGIPVRRLEGWVARSIVRPSVAGTGPGSRRRFSRADVLVVAFLDELRPLLGGGQRRLSQGPIARELQDWVGQFDVPSKDTYLVAYRKGKKIAVLVGEQAKMAQTVKKASVSVVIHIAKLQERVDAGLRET